MAKAKIRIGYTDYIMDEDAAFALFKAMNGKMVERLENQYNSDTKTHTKFVRGLEDDYLVMTNVPDEDYAMWKLAGASR